MLHGKVSIIMILVSSTKKYSVRSAITLYHATMQPLEVAWYILWDRTLSILYNKDHDTFYLWPIRDLGLRSGGYNIINK